MSELRQILDKQNRIARAVVHRCALVVLSTAFALLNVWIYRTMVSPVYAYAGMIDLRPPGWIQVVAVAIAAAPSLFLPRHLDRPSVIVQWFFYLLTFVPAAFIPFYILEMPVRQVLTFELVLLFCFWLLHIVARMPRVAIPRLPIHGWPLIIAFMIFSYAFVAQVFGLSLRYISLEDVYTVRLAFRDTAMRVGRWPSYFILWISNVINPILIIRGLTSRAKALVICGVVGQLVIYSITAFKSVLFSWVLIGGTYFLIRKSQRNFGLRVSLAATAATIATSWDGLLRALFIVRGHATGMLTGWYFEFFSSHPKAVWGDSFLRGVVRYPYDVAVPYLIGVTYLKNVDTHANAHVLADAYANYGYPAMIVWTVLWGCVLWAYDSISQHMDWRVPTLLMVVQTVAFANIPLHTTLMTSGLALLMVFLYLMPAERLPVRQRTVRRGVPAPPPAPLEGAQGPA